MNKEFDFIFKNIHSMVFSLKSFQSSVFVNDIQNCIPRVIENIQWFHSKCIQWKRDSSIWFISTSLLVNTSINWKHSSDWKCSICHHKEFISNDLEFAEINSKNLLVVVIVFLGFIQLSMLSSAWKYFQRMQSFVTSL